MQTSQALIIKLIWIKIEFPFSSQIHYENIFHSDWSEVNGFWESHPLATAVGMHDLPKNHWSRLKVHVHVAYSLN